MTIIYAGHTVLTMTRYLGENTVAPLHYHVAEPDPQKAIEIVRHGTGATPDETISVVGPLSVGDIAGLGLAPGAFTRA